MAIEDVFSAKGRVKILRILSEMGELNISEIARRAGLNYATANQHLKILEDYNLVIHKTFGRIRIFRYNEKNPRAKMISQLMEFWEETK
jgi:DNA-binding transcriptional ArsR family regulator